MDISLLTLLTALFLVLGIFGIAVVSEKNRTLLSIIVVSVNAIITTIPAILALAGDAQNGSFSLPNLPGMLVEIRVDKLSAWFILIINFTSLNGALFGRGYLKSFTHLKTNVRIHWIAYMLFHISMIWVCMFNHGIMFLVSWELMLQSSLLLVIFEYQNRNNLRAGLKYLINMHVSVVLLTIGFIWIYTETGSMKLSALSDVVPINHSTWIFVLFFFGFAIKAGFLPFHTWLPDADSTAPSHVAGLMSGVLVKLGIFGILRILSYINHDFLLIGELILSISILTSLYGVINMAVRSDFNRSLAYCSMENIGIVGIGIGIGVIGMGIKQEIFILLGFSGALLHVLNHSFFKSLLFFSTGSVLQQTGTRNVEKLGGLIKAMPKTAFFFLIGALAVAGLPPFNGFVSEFIIYTGLFKGLFLVKGISHVILIVLSLAGLVLVGGISVFSFTKLFGTIFLGTPRSSLSKKPVEPSLSMRLPQYFIVAAILSVAFFPNIYFNQVLKIVDATFPTWLSTSVAQVSATGKSLLMLGRISIIFVLLATVLYSCRHFVTKNRKQNQYETWGCGYVAPISKAQYSGRSFTRTFVGLFSYILVEEKTNEKIMKGNIYPEKIKSATSYFDLLEVYLVNPIIKRISIILNYFQFIQNGKIQSYVIYGLFFILLVFIGTALGLIM